MRWGLVICAMLVAQITGFEADAAVRLGFVDSGTRFAMERAVAGANRRLTEPQCLLGLAENPPTSEEITARVVARCSG